MKFLKEKPALLLDELEEKTLVLSDLHLGIEYEIYKKGISIPPRVDKQKKRILKLIEETGSERLILLGDVKHNVPRMSIGEKERLPELFQSLCQEVEVIVAKGNHDGDIEDLLDDTEVEVHPASGFRIGDFYFNHGHAWPGEEILEAETLIRGHSHPAIEFKDKLGFSSILPCWLKCQVNGDGLRDELDASGAVNLENAVVVPSFNELISGMPVNREKEKSLLGPILENGFIDLEGCEVYLLDGTLLGNPSGI